MKERITPKDDIEIYNAVTNENTDKTQVLKWALCGKGYEDIEEQGLIVRLPCKVGDKLYEPIKGMPIQVWEIEEIRFAKRSLHNFVLEVRRQDGAYWRFWEQDIDIKLFTTRAAAEKKLKELKGEK